MNEKQRLKILAVGSRKELRVSKRLFLAHTAVASGAELALYRLVKNMDPDTTAVAFAADGPMVTAFRGLGIPVHVQEASGESLGVKRSERSLLRLLRTLGALGSYGWHLGGIVAKSDTTILIAYSLKSMLYGYIAAKRARVPLVWSVHDRISPDYFGALNTLLLRVLGLLLPTAIIVNSRTTLSTIWSGNKSVLVLPPGIETNRLGTERITSGDVKRVTMVGRLSPWKGQREFIQAFERVFAGSTVEALVVGGALFGEQEYEDALRDHVASGPCRNQIRFTGPVEDVGTILLTTDIMVHASVLPEPFGAVVLEGLDAGCAVIATRPGGPAEVIDHGVNGLLVQCGDVDALEHALRVAWMDNELRQRISEAGAARAADFDIRTLARQADEWLSLLVSYSADPWYVVLRKKLWQRR